MNLKNKKIDQESLLVIINELVPSRKFCEQLLGDQRKGAFRARTKTIKNIKKYFSNVI